MDAVNTLANLAAGVFALFIQFIVGVVGFFLVLARMILTALHLQ